MASGLIAIVRKVLVVTAETQEPGAHDLDPPPPQERLGT